MNDLIALVNEQAEDPGLWCLEPTIAEHMLQQALRNLHAAVEAQCFFDKSAYAHLLTVLDIMKSAIKKGETMRIWERDIYAIEAAVSALSRLTEHPLKTKDKIMPKFRKKPVVIEAVRWRGYSSGIGITSEPADQPLEVTMDNMGAIKWDGLPAWLPRVSNVVTDEKHPAHPKPGEIWRDGESLWIGTLEGNMVCSPGDWIIQGIKGELYPCKPDIFAATYEPVA